MMLRPKLLICDEPVSSLDVSIQGQIVNLLLDLQRDIGTAMLFISHNLAVVRHLSHRVLVMYSGRLVEIAARDALFARPGPPLHRALLAAVPRPTHAAQAPAARRRGCRGARRERARRSAALIGTAVRTHCRSARPRCRRSRKWPPGIGSPATVRASSDSAILALMTQRKPVRPSDGLANVRYEIRGKLARRALALERLGYDIVSLNIGNPYAFGFRTPETMRLAMIENLRHSEGYVHQKGIFPAREAVVMQQQERGVRGVTAEEVFIGNGVSELIDLTLRALLNPGDEVLVPSPDYPLVDRRGESQYRPRGALSLSRRARLHAGSGGNRGADHAAHARHRHRQSEQSHRRGVSARDLDGDRAHRREAPPGGAVRRDLRSNSLRRCRVRADGDAGARHAVLHDERPVEGLSRLRLSRRLGVVFRRHRKRGRILERPRVAVARCACAATCPASGRCRRRSAAIRAFGS